MGHLRGGDGSGQGVGVVHQRSSCGGGQGVGVVHPRVVVVGLGVVGW